MRLWSLHPQYLDPQAIVALWREALLAQAVLNEQTRGYRNHPQLARFRAHDRPQAAIATYLAGVHAESVVRGYSFDGAKIGPARIRSTIPVTTDQMRYEFKHLLQKLQTRNPDLYQKWRGEKEPLCHPIFHVVPGAIESWERVSESA